MLDEAAWVKAAWTENFVDIEGSLRPVPRFRTRAKMLWDKNFFYIAAELQEPDIWATLTNRDDIIFYDNDFEVFIDPDGNTHQYCELEMNAFNTVWDLLLIKPYRDINKAAIHDWDIKGLKTGVAVYGTLNKPDDTDSCWTVEIAFPWSAFEQLDEVNLPPHDGDQWRINFSRVQWQIEVKNGKYQKIINPETNRPYPEDNWVWSPHGVVNMHYPELWGYVQFSAEPVGKGTVQFVERPEEQAKWLLRQLYYGQRNYRAQRGEFTEDLKQLGLNPRPIPGYDLPPTIRTTPAMFEASLRSQDNSTTIHIRHDGLTWKDATKK